MAAAVPHATLGLFCENQPQGYVTLGLFCDAGVVPEIEKEIAGNHVRFREYENRYIMQAMQEDEELLLFCRALIEIIKCR